MEIIVWVMEVDHSWVVSHSREQLDSQHTVERGEKMLCVAPHSDNLDAGIRDHISGLPYWYSSDYRNTDTVEASSRLIREYYSRWVSHGYRAGMILMRWRHVRRWGSHGYLWRHLRWWSAHLSHFSDLWGRWEQVHLSGVGYWSQW